MGRKIKSQVVKSSKLSGNKRKKVSAEDAGNSSEINDHESSKKSSKINKGSASFVYKDSNMATKNKFRSNPTKSTQRVRNEINYHILNKNGRNETFNNNATIDLAKRNGVESGLRSKRIVKPGIKMKTRLDKGKEAPMPTENVSKVTQNNKLINDSVNSSSTGRDDGVLVTVHAPMEEFDEDEMMTNVSTSSSEDENDLTEDEVGKNGRSNKSEMAGTSGPSESQADRGPPETEEEILARYSNNPHFKNLVQNLLKSSIQGGECQDRDTDVEDTRNVECVLEVNTDPAPPARKRMRTETVSRPGYQGNNLGTPKGVSVQTQLIHNSEKVKSPLDTTIYAPGLEKFNHKQNENNNRMLNKISNFVENVRQEVTYGHADQQVKTESPR